MFPYLLSPSETEVNGGSSEFVGEQMRVVSQLSEAGYSHNVQTFVLLLVIMIGNPLERSSLDQESKGL